MGLKWVNLVFFPSKFPKDLERSALTKAKSITCQYILFRNLLKKSNSLILIDDVDLLGSNVFVDNHYVNNLVGDCYYYHYCRYYYYYFFLIINSSNILCR